MAFYFSRRRLRRSSDEQTGELNIVPYLDIMMNLIMFMLLSMTGLVSLGVVNASASGRTDRVDSPAQAPPPAVTVLLGERGLYLAGPDGSRVPGPGPDLDGPSIPRGPDGRFDFSALGEAMDKMKDACPLCTRVTVSADPRVPYELVVRALDACRERRGRLLFIDVSVAVVGRR